MGILAVVCSGLIAATPIVIADATKPTTEDFAQIDGLERTMFTELSDVTTYDYFTVKLPNSTNSTIAASLRGMDELCGKVKAAERVDTYVLGSLYVRRILLVSHERCLTRWKLTYAKKAGKWSLEHFNFHTTEPDW